MNPFIQVARRMKSYNASSSSRRVFIALIQKDRCTAKIEKFSVSNDKESSLSKQLIAELISKVRFG